MNWMRGVKANAEFLSFVENSTTQYSDLPLKARVWIAVYDDPPACKYGRERAFKDIESGWKFCSKDKSCQCLAEHKSEVISSVLTHRKEEALAEARKAALPDDRDAIAELQAMIEEYPKSFPRLLLSRPSLMGWIENKSKMLPEHASVAERCYVALNGPEETICKHGQRRSFASVLEGYHGSCEDNSHCLCRREDQAEAIRTHHAALSEEERRVRVERQQKTLLAKYGVTNAVLIPEAQERRRETSLRKYGADHHMRSKTFREEWEKRFSEKHGATSPGAVGAFQEKARKTNLERYGSEYTVDQAREAFAKRHDGLNPFQVPEIARKVRETMLEKYGVERPLMSEDIRERMREKLIERYAADNVMRVPDVVEKMRQNSLVRYRHGVELPKSSYETAITGYLESIGVSGVIRGDRQFFRPYEIDILIPDHRLTIEFCGLYWHRDGHVDDKRYHLRKLEEVEKKGFRLITIFEDEWLERPEVVKSRLRHACGKSPKIAGARHLTSWKGITSKAAEYTALPSTARF